MRVLIFCLLMMSFTSDGTSQAIRMYAYPHADTMRLIWLPDGFKTWEDGIEQGFKLYRSTIMDNGILATQEEQNDSKVFIGKFVCEGEDSWMSSLDTTDQWEVLAAGMVYGDFEVEPSSEIYKLGYMMDSEVGHSNRHLFNIIGVSNSGVAAEKMGYTHTDTGLIAGNIYQYEISLGESEAIINNIVVQAGRKPEWRKIEQFNIKNTPGGILARWEIVGEYTNYEVYRSIDGINWEMINDVPVMTVVGVTEGTYLDQSVEGEKEYYYRVRGKTIFGLWGPYSEELLIKRMVEPEEGTLIITSFEEKEKGVKIGWQYNGEAQLNELLVLYSEAYDGPYREIEFSKIEGSENVQVIEALKSGYIQVAGLDEYGRVIRSVRRLYNPIDITPPAPPQHLECEVDTMLSRVVLNWSGGNEPDLLGYRVYFSNQKEGNYLDMGLGVMDSAHWIMPVQYETKGESLFFKVKAVDQRYNASTFSEVCEVVLPDRKPPAAPLIRKIKDIGSNIEIEWAISPSWDVKEHLLERREEGTSWEMLVLKKEEGAIRMYRDTMVEAYKTYYYRIGAKDRGGNITYTEERSGKIGGYEYQSGIEGLTTKVENGNVTLSWRSAPPGALKRMILYRQVDDGDWITYKVFSQQDLRGMVQYEGGSWNYHYIDESVGTFLQYQYSIRQVWQDGRTSRKSDAVEVNLK